MGCGSSSSKISKKKENSDLIQEGTKISLDKKTSSFFTYGQNKRAFRLQNDLYVEQEKIGSGSFSDVFLYKKDIDGSLHALKILKDNTAQGALLQECKIMRDVQSQFVIKIEEIIQIDDNLCIMIEYANQGTLESFISKISQQTVNVNASQLLDLACDIFQGLNILHIKNIIHRDLKMENLLVSNYQAKIADLGVSTYLISKSYAKTNIGNILYAAPEKLNEKYNAASDIFSAGLIILQIIIGLSNLEVLKIKISQNYTSQIQDSPENLKNFITSLLDSNQKSRPSAIDAYNLCRKLKYDQEVLNYINNIINGVNSNLFDAKNLQACQFNSQQQKTFQTVVVSNSNSLDEQLFQKGMNLYWNSDITSAEKCFDMILEKNPVSIKGLCGRLLCGWSQRDLINMKQYSKEWQQDQLKFIQQLNSNDYMYHYCSGVINLNIDSFNKCIELNPNMAEAVVWKASLLADQKKEKEAIQFGQQALQMSQDNQYVLRMLGYIYDELKYYDISEKFYLRSLQINPKQYVTLHNLGFQYKDKNEFDKALEYFNQALQICPYYKYSITQKLNIMSINKNQHEEVIEIIEKLFKEYGEQDFLYFCLAYSYQEINNFPKAIIYYMKALTCEEESNIFINIGNIYDKQQDYEKASEYYQKAIQKQNKLAYMNMYFTCINQNQEERGKKYLVQLLKLEFDINNQNDCIQKIKAHRLLKQYKQALSYSELSLKQHPQYQALIDEVLILISNKEFLEELSQQNKLSELIQKNFGISLKSTICQLKYLRANKMDDLIVTQILNYYEEIIRKKQEQEDNLCFQFCEYVNNDQFQKIFQGLKTMCQNDPSNIYCHIYFLGLMNFETFILFTFSQQMIQDLEKEYKNSKIHLENLSVPILNTRMYYLLISQMYCLVNNEALKLFSFEKFKQDLDIFDKTDILVKKKLKSFHEIQQLMYGIGIGFLEKTNQSQNEIDKLKKIKSQKLKEAFEIFPDFKMDV
ncbi:hypothetical protein ABPG74_016593 [Tetrahymena malaccensis]